MLGLRIRRGFTLIELLIVIAIIAIISIIIVLVLNPAELLRQSRDSLRLSDTASVTSAIGIFQANGGTGSLGSSNVVYVSIPDPVATSSRGDQCQGLGLPLLPAPQTYHCSATSTFRSTDSSGWIPVNFRSLSAGSPFGSLPIDPINTSSSRDYYAYATNGSQYEITGAVEAQKYKFGGTNDIIQTDGGPLASDYEKGTQVGLEPLDYSDPNLIGFWRMDEGSGAATYDYSGNNISTTLIGSPTWTSGEFGTALQFNGANYASTTLAWPTAPGSLSLWAYPTGYSNWISPAGWKYAPASGGYILIDEGGGGGTGAWRGVYNPTGAAECSMSSGSIVQNQWYNLVMTWVLSGPQIIVTLYVNGAQVGQAGCATGASASIGPFAFGTAGQSANNDFIGSVDNVRVYNRALSTAEITAIYNSGK